MSAEPENAKDANTREYMQAIAMALNEVLPDGWGFFVMAFPFEGEAGRMNYASNARREDIHKLMQEFLAKGGAKFEHV